MISQATGFRCALFDMDGTLVDSMGYWRTVHLELAETLKPDLTPEERAILTGVYTYPDIMRAFERVGLRDVTLEQVTAFMEDTMAAHYRRDVRVKPGAIACLEAHRAAGARMGIITMTPHREAEICLETTGIAPYFDFVLTPEDMPDHSCKETPAIFLAALRRLHCRRPGRCVYYEDSVYAIRTARRMGFYIRAVADPSAAANREEILRLADEYLDFDGPRIRTQTEE